MTARRRLPLLVLGLVVLALVAVAVRGGPGGAGERRLTATFPSTVNLYEGAEVKVLGVGVGEVTDVEVVGTAVRVRMTYRDDVDLPADVQAMIVPPSIVGDRFVQLAPAYSGSGPTLADDAVLDQARTAVPVELDETYRQLDAIARALGPQGVNRDGSLSRLVRATARALDGNGAEFRRTVDRLADALDTLDATDPAYQATVSQAASITRNLLRNDRVIRRVVVALARVGGQLNAQRDDIARASVDLSAALRDVADFTRANRAAVRRALSGTRDVSRTLVRRIDELRDLLALAPVGFVSAMNINLPTNWSFEDPGASSPRGRTTSYIQRGIFTGTLDVQLSFLLSGVCETATGPTAAQLAAFCSALGAAGNDLGLLLTEVMAWQQDGSMPSSLAEVESRLRAAAASGGAR